MTVCLIQMTFGAFTAGLNAGLAYNTFPYMGRALIPSEVLNARVSIDSLSEPVIVLFIHRMLGCILFVMISIYCLYISKIKHNIFYISVRYMLIAIIVQVTGGIFTTVYKVPIVPALVHQVGSIFVVSSLLWCYFLLSKTTKHDNT